MPLTGETGVLPNTGKRKGCNSIPNTGKRQGPNCTSSDWGNRGFSSQESGRDQKVPLTGEMGAPCLHMIQGGVCSHKILALSMLKEKWWKHLKTKNTISNKIYLCNFIHLHEKRVIVTSMNKTNLLSWLTFKKQTKTLQPPLNLKMGLCHKKWKAVWWPVLKAVIKQCLKESKIICI